LEDIKSFLPRNEKIFMEYLLAEDEESHTNNTVYQMNIKNIARSTFGF